MDTIPSYCVIKQKKITDLLGETPPIISVGSLVPLLFNSKGAKGVGGKAKALEVIRIVRKLFPKTMIHALGIGGALTYLAIYFGADSFDNNGWIQKTGFGVIQVPGSSDRFLGTPPNGRKKIDTDEIAYHRWLECVCPACRSSSNRSVFIGRDESARLNRGIHNAYTFQAEIWRVRRYIHEGQYINFIKERMKNSIYLRILQEELNRNDHEKIFNDVWF